ncbi:hypothetical protein ACFL1H_03060 [Nanoarchaeota archaeon]
MPDEEVGKITHFFSKISVAVIEITSGELKPSDQIKIKGATSDFQQKIETMEIDRKPVDVATAGQAIGLKVIEPVREGDVVFKVEE